jgi:hypothetical protein
MLEILRASTSWIPTGLCRPVKGNYNVTGYSRAMENTVNVVTSVINPTESSKILERMQDFIKQ